MAKYLDPKADLTFKKIFGEHKHLLFAMSGMKPIFRGVLAFCTACFLMVCCAPHSSSESETLREEANGLYNSRQYQEALDTYEKALSSAQGKDRLTIRP